MAGSDGSVVIPIEMNVSDAEKKLAQLKRDIAKTEADLNKKKAGRIPLAQELDEAVKAARKASLELEKMKASLEEANQAMSPDTTQGMALPFDKFMQYRQVLDEVPGKIREQEAEYEKLNAQTERIVQRVNKYDQEIANTEVLLNNQIASWTEIAGATNGVSVATQSAVASTSQLGERADNASGSMDSATQSSAWLSKNTKESAQNTQGIADSAEKSAKNTEHASNAMKQFSHRAANLANRVFVFSLITSALRTMRTCLENIIKTNSEATAAIAKLKGVLLTLAQPIINVIIPAFITFINLLIKVINTIAQIVSKIFGTTAKDSAEAAKNLYDEQKALEGVGSAAKKAGKSMASFDEINQLSGDGDSEGGGASTDSGTKPDFSSIGDGLSAIQEMFFGAALLAIGAILTFSGANVLLGITLMALGAYAIYTAVTENPEEAKQLLEGWMGDVLVIAGMIAIIIGTFLAFSGSSILLGLGLIALGAAALFTEAALAPDKLKEMLDGWLGELLVLVGITAVIMGVLLAFSGVNIPLGIALMALGAVSIIKEAVMAPDKMKEMLNGWLGTALIIGGITALVLGAVLTFSGFNLPLGIALMALGAVSIITEAVMAPDKMKEMLNGWLGTALIIGGIIALVLGAVLTFSGFNLPLGIALMALGAASLVTMAVLNWDWIVEKLKGVADAIKNKVIYPLAIVFKVFYNTVVGIMEGVINGFIGIINGFINGINWVIDTINKIPGVNLGKIRTLNTVSIPRLAEGAVIPPNREFMAVLGDQKSGYNIETPLDTMVQAFRRALSEGGYGGGNGQTTVILEVDREQFGKAVFNANNRESRRIGMRLVEA